MKLEYIVERYIIVFFIFYFILFFEGEAGAEEENLKQTPHPVWSPTWGSIS